MDSSILYVALRALRLYNYAKTIQESPIENNEKTAAKVPLLLTLASFVIVVAGMKAASSVLVPFFVAVFVALICAPPFFWLQRKGVPRILALLLILVAILVAGFLLGALMGPSLNDFLRSLPTYQNRLSMHIGTLQSWLDAKGIIIPMEEMSSTFDPGWFMRLAGDILSTLSGILTNTFLILLTVMFILLEAADLPNKLRLILKDPERSLSTIEKFSLTAKHYLIIKTLVSAATGFAVWLWLVIIGVDYPVLWGMLAFLLNYIPNIGSIIAAVPAVLLALVQSGVGLALLTILGFLVINVVIGNILEPKVMGNRLSLSTLVVFVSLVFWGWVLGPIGVILSVPITSFVKIALESNENTRGLAILLGSGSEIQKPKKPERKRK